MLKLQQVSIHDSVTCIHLRQPIKICTFVNEILQYPVFSHKSVGLIRCVQKRLPLVRFLSYSELDLIHARGEPKNQI